MKSSNYFSELSLRRLNGVQPMLVDLVHLLLQYHDIKVVYGVRTLEEQAKLYEEGLSKTMNSRHLIQPDGYGWAVDLAPYPIDWNDSKRFYWMAGMMRVLADNNLPDGWKIRWGGNWDMDEDLNDQTFMDLGHFELRKVDGS